MTQDLCPSGHDRAVVGVLVGVDGYRRCRQCSKEQSMRYRDSRRKGPKRELGKPVIWVAACPTCGSAIGAACRTMAGKPLPKSHIGRRRRAERARSEVTR